MAAALPLGAAAQPALVGQQVTAAAGSTGNVMIFDFVNDGAGVAGGNAELEFSSPDLVITNMVCRLPTCASSADTGQIVFFSLSLTEIPDTPEAIEVTFSVASGAAAGTATLAVVDEQYSSASAQPIPPNGTQNGTVNVQRVPIARDDNLSVKEDSAMLNGDLRVDNGEGPDELGNPPYRYELLTGASLGQFALIGDQGVFTYLPDADRTGVDMVSYSLADDDGESSVAVVTITIDPTPDPVDDLVLLDAAGMVIDGQVTADNGLGPDDLGNGPFQVTAVNPPTRAASFELAADGSLNYVADGTFTRSDHFTYEVTDGDGDRGPAATVTVLIDPVFRAGFED